MLININLIFKNIEGSDRYVSRTCRSLKTNILYIHSLFGMLAMKFKIHGTILQGYIYFTGKLSYYFVEVVWCLPVHIETLNFKYPNMFWFLYTSYFKSSSDLGILIKF
jgi:hypothetical protein